MPAKIGILSSQRGYHVREAGRGDPLLGLRPGFFLHRSFGRMDRRPAGVASPGRVHGRLSGSAGANHPCGLPGTNHFPNGCLASAREPWSTGGQFRFCHRAHGRQILHFVPAVRRRHFDSRTLVTEDFETALNACREMGDVVIKPLFGSEGKGMVRARDEETAYRVLRAWELNRYIYYIQEYLPHFQEDIRAFVVGEEVVAAMRRRGTGWKTNYSQGAQAEAVELSSEMKALALKAARLIDLDYAGVDIIPAENGKTYVVEINSIPGWRGLKKSTDRKSRKVLSITC